MKKAVVVLAATVMSFSVFAQRGGGHRGGGFNGGVDVDLDFNFRQPARQQVKRFELRPDQFMYRGQNTLRIMQMLNQEYPRRNFQNFDIKAVVLFAKSARGFGEATLIKGRDYVSSPETIPGNRYDFRNYGNFHRIALKVPQRAHGRRLQVDLRGRIKIDRIVVRAVRKGHGGGGHGGGHGRLQYKQVDSFKAEKFIALPQTIRVRERDVQAIKLEADKNPVDITSAVVVYGNGDREHLTELEGPLRDGGQKVAKLGSRRRGETVRRLEITSTSLLPWGSRGVVKVSIGK